MVYIERNRIHWRDKNGKEIEEFVLVAKGDAGYSTRVARYIIVRLMRDVKEEKEEEKRVCKPQDENELIQVTVGEVRHEK